MSSIESLSDTDMLGVQQPEDRVSKRIREESESEWTTVQRREKKLKDSEKIEVYITSNEKLPKQFKLARIFKEQQISDIIRVKYLNPYKVRVDLISELSAEKLESCQAFQDMKWQTQKALEQKYSYAIIKDVDLELSNEQILEKIKCAHPALLISANRLNRRNLNEHGWIPSETVRLCFKGCFIPAYVNVDEMRIKVNKYVFPVSQCSRCWKFGHIIKRCPSAKIVCPKCGKNHANCEITQYKCINCEGKHMALSKVCPLFLKEKNLRNLMCEFNCTYRKALEMYVESEPIQGDNIEDKEQNEHERQDVDEYQLRGTSSPDDYNNSNPVQKSPTFAEITKNNRKQIKKNHKQSSYASKIRKVIHNKKDSKVNEEDVEDTYGNENYAAAENESTKKKTISILLRRLKEIVFLREDTIQMKIMSVLKCCIEWIVVALVDKVEDWPILKSVLSFFQVQDEFT